MILPIPGVRKECRRCYQLLDILEWRIETHIDPYYMIGSSTPNFVQRSPPTCTVKGFCGGCLVEIESEYIENQGIYMLLRESIYQDERMV